MSSGIQTSFGHVGHSAEIKMHLTIAGKRLSVRQMGPDFLIMDPSEDYPPTIAQLYLSVDGHEREWPVFLPDGITGISRRVTITKP